MCEVLTKELLDILNDNGLTLSSFIYVAKKSLKTQKERNIAKKVN